MKAIAAPAFTVVDIPEPTAKAGQVVVRVQHAGVNPIDWKLAGLPRLFLGLRSGFPFVTGVDFAGIVVSVGSGVVGLAPGDLVAGACAPLQGQRGSYAERVCVGASQVTKVPPGVPAHVAAVLPVVGTTAWQSLFEIGHLRAAGRLLVLGAAGGVGHIAVQLGKGHGAHVTGVCSKKNLEEVKKLGADVVVDYQTRDPLTLDERFDVVFDAVGSYAPAGCRRLLAPGGTHVTVSGGPGLLLGGQRSRMVIARSDADLLKKVLDDVAAGKVRPLIAARYPLAQAAQAVAASKTGRTLGKILLDVA